MPPVLSVLRTTSLFTDTDGDGQFDPNEVVLVRIRVTNTGDQDALNVSVTDTVGDPGSGITFIPGSIEVSPIPFNDAYNVTGNTPITIGAAQGLLANDQDPDGPEASLVVTEINGNPFTVGVPFNIVDGAFTHTLSMNADGSFTFTPDTGYEGAFSFTYTAEDAQGLENPVGGTVTFNVGGANGMVWYVNSAAAPGGDGSFNNPFQGFTELNGVTGDGSTNDDVDAADHTIFVYDQGATAYSAGITLENGQDLIGDGGPSAFIVNGITISAAGGNNTTIQHSTYGVTLGQNNTISGVSFDGTATTAIGIQDGGGSVGTLTISNSGVTGSGKAVDIDQGGVLNVNLGTLSSSNSTTQGVHLSGDATTAISGTFTASSGIITGAANQGFLIGSGVVNHGGTVAVTYGGDISSTGASAVTVFDRAASAGDITFSGNITATGTSIGIQVSGLESGTVAFTGNKTITGTGTDVGVSLDSISGGTVTFNTGTFTIDTVDGSAITMAAITGGTINFSAAQSAPGVNIDIDVTGNGNGISIAGASGGASAVNFTGGGLNITTANSTGLQVNNAAATNMNLNITGAGNSITTGVGGTAAGVGTGGALMALTNVQTNTGIDFDTLDATESVNGIAISAVNVDGGVAADFADVEIAGATAGAISLTTGSSMSFNFGATTIGEGANTVGGTAAVTIAAGTGNVNFATIDTDNVTGHGVLVQNHGGNVNLGTSGFGTSGTIQDTGGNAVRVEGQGNTANVNVVVAANVAKTTAGGQVIFVDDKDGGAVIFQGNVNASGGSGGIRVEDSAGDVAFNHTSATVTLSTGTGNAIDFVDNAASSSLGISGGALTINTTSGTGFNASGGGSVVVAQNAGANTITSTTGTALSIVNTNIDANDVTFQSISSSGGSANGIILDNTGSAGGLHVLGNGAAGTGGTIANKTGADGSTTQGSGIYLNNTADVQLNWMQLNGFQNYAIRGLQVNGFTLNDSVINGTNGNNAGLDEGSVVFGVRAGTNGATGNFTITDTTISGGFENNLGIFNGSGTVTALIDNVSINGAGNDGIGFEMRSTATGNIDVRNSDFTDNLGDAFNATGDNAANLNVLFGNNGANVISSNPGNLLIVGGSVVVQTGLGWSGTGSANISNNTITHAEDTPINVNIGGTGTFGATITNNVIGISGVAGSGTDDNEDAIRIVANGDGAGTNGGTLNALVSNNLIQQVSGRGIFVIARDGGTSGDRITINLTVTGNTLRQSPTTGGQGIRVEAGATASDFTRIHADIGGAGAAANIFSDDWGVSSPGPLDFDEIRVLTGAGDNQFVLTNLGAFGSFADIGNYLEARNGLDGTTLVASASGTLADFSSGGTPPQPLMASEFAPLPEEAVSPEPTPPTGDATPPTEDPTPPTGDPTPPSGGPTPPTSDPTPPAPPAHPVIVDDNILTEAELDWLAEAAINRWAAAGASAEQLAAMRATDVSVADMLGLYLGSSSAGTVLIDSDAAGYGWFLDLTPEESSEFFAANGRLYAKSGSAAEGRMDLLTVLMHELGHQIGLEDSYRPGDVNELMYGYAAVGQRKEPQPDDLADADPDHVGHAAYALPAVNIGTLPVGQTVDVYFRATINSQTNGLIQNLNNTATATSSNAVPGTANDAETNAIDTLTLGGTVWLDMGAGGGTINNGLIDGTEAGIDGVSVTLFVDVNNDGAWDAGDTQVGVSQLTAGGGNYSFTGLAPGEYIVRIDQDNFDAGGNTSLVASPISSAPNATDPDGGDPDTDNDDNGVQSAAAQATYSLAITLAYNSEPTAGMGNDTNNTVDFGFISNIPPSIALNGTGSTYTEEPGPNSPAGPGVLVLNSATIADPDDTNIESATITITDAVAGDLLGVSGALPAGIGIAIGSTDTNLILSGSASLADYQAALAQITFATSGDNPTGFGTDTIRQISFVVNDGVADSAPQAVAIGVQGTDDVVVNVMPAPFATNEDSPVVVTGLQVTDPDNNSGDYTVVLRVAHGALNIRTDVAGGIDITDIIAGDNGTNGIVIRAPLAEINATLAAANGLTYTPDLNYNDEDTLTVSTYDGVPADPTFLSPSAPLTSAIANTASMVTADLNGDGLLDLVYVSNQAPSGQIAIRLGLPGNNFAAETFLNTSLVSTEIIVGQFNPTVDSFLDIAVANYWNVNPNTQGGLSIFFGNGDGTFGAQQVIQDGTARYSFDLLSGDFDRDGDLDIVMDRRDTGIATLYRSNGDGTFAAPTTFSLNASSLYTSSIISGDVDNDGRLDIIAFNPGNSGTGDPPGTITLVRGAGIGGFQAPTSLVTGLSGLGAGALADLDNDGNLDLVFTNSGVLSIQLGNGDGTFDVPVEVALAGAGIVEAGDVNGDGIKDLVVGTGGGNLSLLVGNGDGTFQAATSLAVNAGPESIAIGDLNGDGDNDIALADGNGAVTVVTNTTPNRGDVDTVAITVTPVNDAPVVVNGTTQAMAVIVEDTPSAAGQSINALLQIHYSDEADNQGVFGGSFPGDFTGIAIVSSGTSASGDWQWLNGAVWTNIGAPSPATALLLTDSVFIRFNPAPNFFGAAPPLSVRLIDNNPPGFNNGDTVDISAVGAVGGTTRYSAATIDLTQAVNAVNDAPVNTVGGAQAYNEDSVPNFANGENAVTGLSVADDATGDIQVTLSVQFGTLTLRTDVAGGVAAGDVTGNGTGSLTITATVAEINATLAAQTIGLQPNGLLYQPNANFNGADTLTMAIDDLGGTGGGALTDTDTKTLIVNDVNDAPTVAGDGTETAPAINEDTPVAATVASLFAGQFGDPLDQQQTVGNPTGSPGDSFAGILVSGNVSGGAAGEWQYFDGVAWQNIGTRTEANALILNQATQIRFNPAADYNGPAPDLVAHLAETGIGAINTGNTDDLTVPGVTGGGSQYSVGTVTLSQNVTAINDAPVNTVPGAQTIDEDGFVTFSTGNGNAIQIADVDDNGGTMQVTLSATNGTLTLSSLVGLTFATGDGAGDPTMTFTGTKAAINAALGTGVTYVPTANYNGPASVQIVTSDLGNTGSPGAQTDSDSIAITVNSVNDEPIGADANVTGSEDDPLVFTAANFALTDPNDSPPNTLAGIIVETLPGQGDLFNNGIAVVAGQFISLADINDGGFLFQPDPDTYSPNYASFQFRVRDNGGTANGGVNEDQSNNTIFIEITPDNRPPVALDDEYTVQEDNPGSITPNPASASGVLGNDTDPDYDTPIAILVSGPSNAASFTFNADGSFTYVPNANFNGTDSFTYKANDGEFDSNVATVTILVTPANDAPVSLGESYNVTEDTLLVVPAASGVLDNDTDVDGDGLNAVLVSGPSNALTFTLNADGSFSYQALANYSGPDSFTYRANDGTANGNIVTVNLTVAAVDDAAVAQPDSFVTNEATVIAAGNVFANNGSGADNDVDGPPLTVDQVNGSGANVGNEIILASGAKLKLNANGTFNYNPNGKFNTLTSLATGAVNTSALDSFTYRVSSGNTVTVLVTVNGLRTVDDRLLGDAGNNTITDAGFNFNDSFFLQQGGNDTATGLGGNDGFYFGTALNGLDNVDGGADIDSVAIQGNYAALVLGNIVKVENFVLLAGNNTAFGDFAGNFYDYNVTTIDANVAAGAILTVIGGNLRVGEDLVFNGAAETDGAFRIFAGQGNDSLTGGAKNDGFFFGADANLNGLDIVNGGPGIDSIALRGNYFGATAIILQPTSMTGVEVIAFLSGHTNEFGGVITLAGFDYDLRTNDANVAAGQRLEVAAGNLKANESLTFNGQAESDGSFRIISGAGDDVLTGGDGDDILYGALGADVLEGRGGADSYIYRFATESTAVSRDRIFWDAGDRIDLSLVDANANTGANEAFTFIGAGAFTGVAGQLRYSINGANSIVEGDVNGDGVADLVIFVDNHIVVAGDFVL